MTCLTHHQLRALSAAAGVVGRPTLRAGLLLSLTVACNPGLEPADDDESSSDPASSSSSASSSVADASSSGHEPTSGGHSGDASSEGGDASSSDGPDLTTGGTLLTDATTSSGDSGETTSGDTGEHTTGDATTGLDDCFIDLTTMEVDWACCEAQNWMPAPQCTPWGPPAPPSAHRDLLARARAARTVLA